MESLRDQVAYLREIVATRDEEIRRRDVIISQLTQRIPEIEAPRESPVTPDSPGPTDTSTDAGGDQETATEHRSWWRRFFGFE